MIDSPFPLRVAAIDVGSNAIRFVAAEFTAPTDWEEIEYLRVPVRLGHQAFVTGRLEESAMAAAVEAMASFRRALDRHEVSLWRAVATSAVRDSRNGGELVERVRSETGIHLETITGREEARLTWTSARTRIPADAKVGGGRWMMVDLGGGSLEISVTSDQGVGWIESHPLGTVRLLEELGADARDQEHLRERVAERAATLRIPDEATGGEDVEGLMATGGNIETLAGLAGCALDRRGASRLPTAELRRWIDRLAGMSVKARIDELELDPDRADVILPAAVLYERVATLAGVPGVVVPYVGVKEGVLVDLIESGPERGDSP